MDSRMIDVAIGLVLVFALSGLMVTTLHEIWSNVGKTRGRNLRLAIRSMLGDEQGLFADAVLAHPLIASLTGPSTVGTGKPSYIGADVLVTALLSHLTKLYCAGVRPETPRAFVAALTLGRGKLVVPEPQQALIDSLGALLDGVDADWDAYLKRVCAWYDAVGERSIGWFKRDTQRRLFVLGLGLAAVVNINPFVIAPRLWNDEVLRTATVEAAQRASAAYAAASTPDADLLRRVAAALQPPDTRTPAAAAALPNAPIHAEVDVALTALERRLTTSMQALNERGSVALLIQLRDALEQITETENFIKLRRSSALAGDRQAVQDASDSIARRLERIGVTPGDERPDKQVFTTLTGPAKKELLARLADLKQAAQNERKRLLPEAATTLPSRLCPPNSTQQQQKLCEDLAGISSAVAQSGLPVGWAVANLPDCSDGPCVVTVRGTGDASPAAVPAVGRSGDEAWRTAKTCMTDLSCAGISVLGWLATALATMLGAPFWFDLLGRLIKLRSAGAPAAAGGAGGGAGTVGGGKAPTGILSTPPSAGIGAGAGLAAAAMRDVQTRAEAGLTPERVRELQTGALGTFGAKPTGFFDEDMRQAIMAWQTNVQQSVTGELTQAQIEMLLAPGIVSGVLSGAGQGPAPGVVPVAGGMLAGIDDAHVDGCDCVITSATPDESLPPAQGGVNLP